MPIRISVQQKGIKSLIAALKQYADGTKLRRELSRDVRRVLEPAAAAARASIMGMASGGVQEASEPLRTAVAGNVKVEGRLTGKAAGGRIRAKRTESTRNFKHAPKRLNSKKGFRRKAFGGGKVIIQMGKPGWFDDPIRARRAEMRAAVIARYRAMANDIAMRSKGRE